MTSRDKTARRKPSALELVNKMSYVSKACPIITAQWFRLLRNIFITFQFFVPERFMPVFSFT